MAFPQSPLGIKVQANLTGLGWTDITRNDTYGYKVRQEDGITITRGTSNEQDRTPASVCSFSVQDPNGALNNDNPRSPYFGVLPRNTPVRVYVPRATPALLIVDLPTATSAPECRTTDKAALDIVGDIEIRFDFEPARFRRWSTSGSSGTTARYFMLGGKSNSLTNNRSWYVRVNERGFPELVWSTTGSSGILATCNAPLPATGRISLKVTVDVDNGSGGFTITYATASSIAGTYTTLGTPIVTTSGITSFFSGSADLEIGAVNAAGLTNSVGLTNTFVGRFYGVRVYNGIGGSLVANADFTAQSVGATSWADGLGNTWLVTGGAEVTNADYRFHGELSSAPQKWDSSGKDVKTNVEASGVIRRLTTNSTPLQSPIYRGFQNFTPTGYWTGEDGSGAASAGSSVTGSNPAQITDITFGGIDAGLAGSAGTMVLGGTGPYFDGRPKLTANTTTANFYAYYKFPSIPLSNQTLFSIYGNGAVARWDWVVGALNYTMNGYDATGALIVTKLTAHGVGAEPNNWVALHLQITTNGGNTDIKVEWHSVGGGVFYNSNAIGTLNYAGTTGQFTRVIMQGVAALSGTKVAHILTTTATSNLIFVSTTFAKYSKGYIGELAGDRWARICLDQGIAYTIIGTQTDTEAMGAQPIATSMDILYECSDVDGGAIFEPRDQLALGYRTRASMQNQYGLSLSYGYGLSTKQLSGELAPVPDDLNIRNDITLSRKNGSSARASLETGPMSAASPANGGIGRVPDSPEINNSLDSRLTSLVQYMLGLGTWPEARYPQASISLHRSPYTYGSDTFLLASKTDVSDIFTITDLPPWLPPGPLYLLVVGHQEKLTTFLWDITFNASPYGPWRTNELSSTAGEEKRAESSNTVLNAGITSTATAAAFKTTTGALCVTSTAKPSDFPFDVMIGGERVTVSALTGTSSPQTVTLVRSVNGVVKAQAINAPVNLPNDTAFFITL